MKEKKKPSLLLIASSLLLIISVIFMIYGKVIAHNAEQYPKAPQIVTHYSDASETFCHYIESNTPSTILAMIPLVYGILLVIGFITKKTQPKHIMVKIMISGILSMIAVYIGLYDTVQCSINQTWKPVLYLYPEEQTTVKVELENEKLLGTTYPQYKKGWMVEAYPDGSLYDQKGNYYYALYWDEKASSKCKFENGFYVTKENAISFLEEKLTYIGLNDKERNEFIMYWLPTLEQNQQSIVQFDLTEELQEKEKLIITPKPDSLIRIHINIKKVNHKEDIKEQELTSFERKGFTAIEWGGTIY